MKNFISRLLRVSLLTAFLAVASHAEDLGAVKARMEQRLAKIVQLEASGALGETNRGFVDVRAAGGDASEVAAAENRDREVVYAAIAKQQGADVDAVGRARAKKIAATSPAGTWLQHDDGSWHKK
jgi:uncharacterized protein YdbL (DUF1318 family)